MGSIVIDLLGVLGVLALVGALQLLYDYIHYGAPRKTTKKTAENIQTESEQREIWGR